MVNQLIVCILLFLASTAVTAMGQDYPMIHYSTEDGLPSNTIYDVYRDSKGFLWIATDKGIARHNGISFETFTTFNGLPDNEIFFSIEDNQNRLWLATHNGDLCYYQEGVFHTAANTPFLKQQPIKHTFIDFINVEKDGSVSISFSEKPYFLNVKGENIQTIPIKSTADTNIEVGFVKKLSDSAYKVQYDKIFVVGSIKKDRVSLTKTVESEICYPRGSKTIRDLTPKQKKIRKPCQKQDIYYIGDRVFLNDTVLKKFDGHFTGKFRINRLYFDNTDIFFATDSGLIVNDSRRMLKDQKISCVTQDKLGYYWISTLNNGIYKLSKDFRTMGVTSNVYAGQINYCENVNNRIVFATSDNNLYELKKNKEICLFDYRKYKSVKYGNPLQPGYAITEKGTYYNYYNHDNLVIDNVFSKNKHIRHYKNKDMPFGIQGVCEVNGWVYTLSRKVRINKRDYSRIKEGEEIRHHLTIVNDEFGYNSKIEQIVKSDKGVLWYSNMDSAYIVINDHRIPQPQFRGMSFKTFIFSDGYLIGCTYNNRLYVCRNYDREDISIDTLPKANFIANKFYKVNESHILVSTNSLYQMITLNKDDAKRSTLTTIENPFLPLKADAICIDTARCYFFKNGNVTCISTDKLLERGTPPQLFFSFLRTGNKILPVATQVNISYKLSNNIAIHFETLSFAGKDISYQYSFLKSKQDNWVDFKGEEINLVNPGYGTYFMKVRARTIASDYCVPISFTLHILKPFWATWWFITLSVCAAAIILIMLVRLRLAYLFRKREEQHSNEIKFLKSEYAAHNALMNPHFIFNSLNNVQSLINKNDNRNANKYLGVFANLIRQNMLNVSKGLVPLEKELDVVRNYLELEKLRFKDWLHYAINVDEIVDLADIMIPPLLIQPLVENSIKHGILPRKSAEGFISIDVYEQGNDLVIAVKDNGIGIEAAKKNAGGNHESYGLDNTRKRIAQFAAIQNKRIDLKIDEIRDSAGNLQWTVVSITIGNSRQ